MKSNRFKFLKKEIHFEDDFLVFREDTLETPKKQTIKRKVVEYHPSSAIVPIKLKPEYEILLIRHFRYPISRYLWEIPGGIRKKGESGKACAIRELAEETGYHVCNVKRLMNFCPEPAFTNQRLGLYIGTLMDRLDDRNPMIIEEEIKECRLFTFKEIAGMISGGKIASSWSIIGLLLAMQQCKYYERSDISR